MFMDLIDYLSLAFFFLLMLMLMVVFMVVPMLMIMIMVVLMLKGLFINEGGPIDFYHFFPLFEAEPVLIKIVELQQGSNHVNRILP